MIELIPAIDLIEGKCVRLTKGDYATQKIYNEDPLAVAQEFASYGFHRLHVVDLDGARSNHIVNHKILEKIANHTSMIIDFGGGIKTDEDIRTAFNSGASLVTIGSIAATQPELFLKWLQLYNADHIILGADTKNGQISINGWKENSHHSLIPFLSDYINEGVKHVLCTEISKDGMLEGPAIDLYKQIIQHFPDCNLIASGGVSCIDDLKKLNEAGVPAVVFGKAIYEGKISLSELAEWIEKSK